MKKTFVVLLLLLLFNTFTYTTAQACTLCNRSVKEGIFNADFFPLAGAMVLLFVLLGLVVVGLYRLK